MYAKFKDSGMFRTQFTACTLNFYPLSALTRASGCAQDLRRKPNSGFDHTNLDFLCTG